MICLTEVDLRLIKRIRAKCEFTIGLFFDYNVKDQRNINIRKYFLCQVGVSSITVGQKEFYPLNATKAFFYKKN